MDAVQKIEAGGSGLALTNKELIESNEQLKGELESLTLSLGEADSRLRHIQVAPLSPLSHTTHPLARGPTVTPQR